MKAASRGGAGKPMHTDSIRVSGVTDSTPERELSMRFLNSVLLAGLALVVAASGAQAEPISVEYFVVRSPFKKGTVGTDILTFDLFTDDQCATPPIHTEGLFASDPFVHYYIDRAQRVKGGP